jgi:transposase
MVEDGGGLVAARLCEPASELHIAEDWYRRTALADLLQLGEEQVNKDRLYRALDHLLVHKAAIEAHLSHRWGELFAVENEVLLYDVTSTYFEGEAEANPLAQRGYSRDHRPDCKQVCIALVVTFDGFPLGYEVFAGNTNDSRTLQTIVATMEARHGMVGRAWIADRGMASAANLEWLRESGRRYIIGAPKSELKKFGSALAAPDGWRTIHEGVAVKLTRHPEAEETVILCRSADRRSKEQAMHDRFSQRIETALKRLAARVARAQRRLDPAPVNRQIGRILQQNQRAAARFAVELIPDHCPAGFRLHVAHNAAFADWAALSEGAYLLRSNIADWSDEQLWKAYIQLTQAEAAFRIQKDQLNLRPIWHQRPERVQAHILVCFLAFVLWKSLEMWQCRAGLGNSPRTVLEELARIQSHDIVLPTTTPRSDPPALYHPTRRRPSRPPRPPRHRLTQENAACRTRTARTRGQRLTLATHQKCSADYSAKIINPLIPLFRGVDSAQVRLASEVRGPKKLQRPSQRCQTAAAMSCRPSAGKARSARRTC